MVNHVISSRTIAISEPCSSVKELVLKQCVGYDRLITSTVVQQLFHILVGLSNAVKTNDRVSRGKVRVHMSIKATQHNKNIRGWNKGKSGLESVIEGFRGIDSFTSGVGWVGQSIHSHNSQVGHVAFQMES